MYVIVQKQTIIQQLNAQLVNITLIQNKIVPNVYQDGT